MRISASAIGAFRQCQRRWAFHYIAGIKEPSSESQELGTAVHLALEEWHRDGKPIDGTTRIGEVAQKALDGGGPPQGVGHSESELLMPRGDWAFYGKIDWNGQAPFWLTGANGPGVLDFKTTSDLKYAKSFEQLKNDPQTILYGASKIGDADRVYYRWLYLPTKAKQKKAKAVDFDLSRAHVLAGLDDLEAEAEQLVTLRLKAVDPLSLPPTATACYAYHKACPYIKDCDLSPQERFSGTMSSIGKDALLAGLREKALGNLPPTAPSTPPPMATLPGLPPVAQMTPPTAPDSPPAPTAQIIPPGTIGVPPPTMPNLTPEMIVQLQAMGILTATPPVAPPVLPPPQAPQEFPALPLPAPAEKRKPGRPPGARNKAPMAPATVGGPVLAPPPGGSAPMPGPIEKPIGCLFVNCLPMGEACEFANTYYQTAHSKILESSGGHYKHVEFGKGPALFAILVGEAIEQNPPASGFLFVDSRTPEGSDVLETLTALASQVVRSV